MTQQTSQIECSQCGTRLWVNAANGLCIARFNIFTGYEVYRDPQHTAAFKVGNVGTLQDYSDFANKVFELHGVEVPLSGDVFAKLAKAQPEG